MEAILFSLMIYFYIRVLYVMFIHIFVLHRIRDYGIFNIQSVFYFVREKLIDELIFKHQWYKLSNEEVKERKDEIAAIMEEEQSNFIKKYDDFMDFGKIYKRNIEDYDVFSVLSKVLSFEINPENLIMSKNNIIRPELKSILNKEYLKHEDNPNNR